MKNKRAGFCLTDWKLVRYSLARQRFRPIVEWQHPSKSISIKIDRIGLFIHISPANATSIGWPVQTNRKKRKRPCHGHPKMQPIAHRKLP